MTEDDNNKHKSNLAASVTAMSQRLKATRQQQQQSPSPAVDGSISLSGRSQSPVANERPHSPTPLPIKAAQADLELNIQELEGTSIVDRIRESESRLSDVTAENDKLRSIIEELNSKLMTVMKSNEDEHKERQMQWGKESDGIVKEFEKENLELRKELDQTVDKLDATKSALLMLQEDYRLMGDGVEKLKEELEGERQSKRQLETAKEGGSAKAVEINNTDNSVHDELKDSIKEKDDIINNLRNELEIARGLHEQELSMLRKTLNDERAQYIAAPSLSKQSSKNNHSPRPIIFLDIDGVLNFTKHNKQIQFEATHLKRLKTIVETTNALIVLSTFWRHFHEYITYVLHRHGIDVASCMLPLPIGATRGKQTTKKFLHYHRLKQEGAHSSEEESMIGRSAEDDAEYSSRADEIEAWLKMYGKQYLGGGGDTIERGEDVTAGYDWHREDWKYIILDDRPSAAKPDTPLFDRFVHTATEVGITEDDSNWAIELLLHGPKDAPSRRRKPSSNVKSLDDIFNHKECNISRDLAVLLTPDRSPISRQEMHQSQQEPHSTNAGNDFGESLNSQKCESEILAAMCDYSNVCPTLVALLQPQTMDDNDDYCPLPTMMKSFGEEKKTSFDEIENQISDRKKNECNALEPAVSFDDSITDNRQNEIPAGSPPPMNLFHNFPPNFAGNSHDIGLDDLSHRWKASSLSAAVGAHPLTTKDDLNDKQY